MKWILLVLLIPVAFAFNVTEYEYISTINVACEEYEGNVRFELPLEYVALSNPQSYMDVPYSIDNRDVSKNYVKTNSWFIRSIPPFSSIEIEPVFDDDFQTAFVIEDQNSIELPFENPTTKTIEKIVIDVKDSQISDVTVISDNRIVQHTLKSQDFHYELELERPILTDKIIVRIRFNDVLKIKEVTFFEKKSTQSARYGYFYVDNNCNATFPFYFGTYGEDKTQRGSKILPVVFETTVATVANAAYNTDFDNDTIINELDNCLKVANADQRDINYNNKGDACEDSDGDSIMNIDDNCPDEPNRNQNDADNDGAGDVCDSEDSRFFEQNKVVFILLIAIVAMLFIGASFFLMQRPKHS